MKKAQMQMGRGTSIEEETVLVLPPLPVCAVIMGKSSPSLPLSYVTARPLPAQIRGILSGYLEDALRNHVQNTWCGL